MSKWEQSGNGSGQAHKEGDDDFGHMIKNQLWLASSSSGDKSIDGDNCKNFLHDEKSHLLCLWQIADENDLLSHALAKLSDDVLVDSDNIPSATDPSKRENKDKKNDDKLKTAVATAFKQSSRSVSLKEYREASKTLRELKLDLRKCDDEDEKRTWRRQLLKVKTLSKNSKQH